MSDGGEVSVKFSADDAGLFAAMAKFAASVRVGATAGGELDTSFLKADRSLKKFAEGVKASVITPLEQFAATKKRLDDALSKGYIDASQYDAAIAKAQQLADAGDPLRASIAKTDDELKKFAKHVKELQATPLDRLRDSQEKLNRAVEAGELTVEQADEARQAATRRAIAETRGLTDEAGSSSKGITSQFKGMLSGVNLSVAGAAGLIAKLFVDMRADADKTAQSVQDSFRSAGKLGQIGDAEQTAARRQAAKEYFATGATSTQAEANDVILQLANAGVEKDRKLLADLQKVGLVDSPGDFAAKAQQLRNTLGEDQAGDFPKMVAKAFVAAGPTSTTPDDLIAAASKSGEAASTLGIKVEELLAATSTMIGAKGLEEGGTRMASLLSKLTTLEDVQGAGLADRVADIVAKGMSPAELKKYLGDAQAVEALGILSKQAAPMKALTQDVGGANVEMLATKISENMANPAIAAGVAAASEKARLEVAGGVQGVESLMADARQAQLERSAKEKNPGTLGQFDAAATSMMMLALRKIPGYDAKLAAGGGATYLQTGEAATRGYLPGLIRGGYRTAATQAANELMESKLSPEQQAQIASQLTKASQELQQAAQAIKENARQAPPVRFDTVGPARREAATAEH